MKIKDALKCNVHLLVIILVKTQGVSAFAAANLSNNSSKNWHKINVWHVLS